VGGQQKPFRKKNKKDLYRAFHGHSSHTTEQCRNIRQQGNAQAPRQQQPRAKEVPREAAANQAPQAEQRQDVQRRVIQVITTSDPPSQVSKRQKKMQLRAMHNIALAGVRLPRYLSQPISFGPEDAKGVLFPHQDLLVVSAEMAGFEVWRILIDGGSSADVMFTGTYAKMGLPTLALSQAPTYLRGFGGEAVQVLGQSLIKVEKKKYSSTLSTSPTTTTPSSAGAL
jgi:hypothetical protein